MHAGTYHDEVVGSVNLNLTSPDGGTLSNKNVTVWSPAAQGSFTVDGAGTVRFTGTVTTKCITIPNPQRIPTPIQPIP
jgi:hypothetical protein